MSFSSICIRAPLQAGIFIHLVSTKCIFFLKIPLFCSAMSEGHVQKKQLHFPESSLFGENDLVNTKQNNTAVPLENIKAHKEGKDGLTEDLDKTKPQARPSLNETFRNKYRDRKIKWFIAAIQKILLWSTATLITKCPFCVIETSTVNWNSEPVKLMAPIQTERLRWDKGNC